MTSFIPFALFLLLLKLCTNPTHTARASSASSPDAAGNGNGNGNAPTIRRRRLGVTIGGVVYHDINRNGERDPNESGVADAPVQIRTCGNGRVGDTRSNSGGEFVVELPVPGCYYARFDVGLYNFTEKGRGSDVDPDTGRTEGVEIEDGQATFWYAGVIPDVNSSITLAPTDLPTTSTEPTTSAPTLHPSPVPLTTPSVNPTSSSPTAAPSTSRPPTGYPTATAPPSECTVRDAVEENIMSSSPILRSSFGTVFSVSTPARNETPTASSFRGEGGALFGGDAEDEPMVEMDEHVEITSLSLRVLTPLLSPESDTNYQVWHREGDYRTEEYDFRGDLGGWTLIAEGNSLGSGPEDDVSGEAYREPLALDSNFLSGAFPSDNNDYNPRPSSLLDDGGMETLNAGGARINTYLYKIPPSAFRPVSIPKHGGQASFYVTLDRAALQYGPAEEGEWDAVDVENGAYDPKDNANLRIHVGEGVTSFPWGDVVAFYQPRRFLGKVWYEHVTSIPCRLHVGAPSAAPSEFQVPPLPGAGRPELGAVGEAVETTFVLSVFMQQDINYARKMDEEIMDAFRPTMVDFLNEEWVVNHCVWGVALDVEFQKLSLLEGVRRRHLRRLKTEITILQVEMFVKGVAHDDPRVCPAVAVPATPTTRGEDWDETMSQIGIDFILANANELGERLKMAHAYFEEVFAVSADSTLLERPKVAPVEVVEIAAPTEEKASMLIPIVAAVCAAVLLLCLLGIFCYCRKRKLQRKEEEEPPKQEDDAISTPSGIVIITDPDKCDESSLGHKTRETKEVEFPDSMEEEEGLGLVDPDDYALESEEPPPPEVPLSSDPLVLAKPALKKVPQLEEVVMMRGLPRRRSDPGMVTVTTHPEGFVRTRSLSCLREVWINLNKPTSKNNPDLAGGYLDQLLDGTLYPVDDHDILYWERERYLRGEDARAPYVPHGGSIEHNFIDEGEALRAESGAEAETALASALSDEIFSDDGDGEAAAADPLAGPKMNPLVMQQVEMLEAKWKQLKEEYDEDGEYDSDECNLDHFNVNERIEQLMTHIEKLELERKMRLAALKRQEQEEDELARKRMVRAGEGINYEEELSRDFVIRKKRKSSKSKKGVEDLDLDDISEETSSSEEEEEEGEFDVKWMRLKVPLAAQDPGAMRSLVNKGKDME